MPAQENGKFPAAQKGGLTMSGIGVVWDIAKDALATSRYAIDVTGHNIANVNTAGYSRQSPIQEAKQPMLFNGLQMGRGVTTTQVVRETDQFLENRLMQQGSNLAYSSEMENYIRILEGVFNEDSETSVSSLLNDYWNLWHDISNNPSGASERIALFEFSTLLSEQFQSLDGDLKQLKTDLTNTMSPAIDKINQITAEIASLNNQIVGMESNSVANDLRDKRNVLVAELSQYIDTNSFEQDNGSLTIVSARGCILVHSNGSYDLALGGINGDRVEWQSSEGVTVDITDYISKGKMGGWLDMRDEVVAKYQLDMDALAKEFIWVTNSQHSKGVGLEAFKGLTTDYAVISETDAIGTVDSGLSYHDKIVDGSFQLWLYDADGNVDPAGCLAISIDADTTSLNGLAAQIDAVANMTCVVNDGKLEISATNGYTFAFSNDSSNALAALGMNTFFKGSNAGSIGMSDTIGSEMNFIAAGLIDNNGVFVSGDNTNAVSMTDLQFATMDISRWRCDRLEGNMEGSITTSVDGYYHALVGSIGTLSESISRERSFDVVTASKLNELRDSISAVSLDEEMANLIKFQHAYSAAAKLITTADEMLTTLLEVK
jgi:flagellar hook-associated protein 1 FlgK